MSASLMRLEAFALSALTIEGRTRDKLIEGTPSEGQYAVAYDIARHPSEPKFRIGATFTATWDDEQPSYFQRIVVGLTGFFAFPPDTPEEIVGRYVPELCLANLYGTARGIVAQASALFPGGPCVLPLVNMRDIIKTAMPESNENSEVPKKPPSKRRRKAMATQMDALE